MGTNIQALPRKLAANSNEYNFSQYVSKRQRGYYLAKELSIVALMNASAYCTARYLYVLHVLGK
jgi:hypothetical protein